MRGLYVLLACTLLIVPAAGQAETAAVLINDQESNGATVRVASVTMSSGGFVVLHNDTLLAGDGVGSVVGVSEYLTAGTQVNVDVPVRGLPDHEQTLIAMPHRDTNGNQQYDFVTSNGSDDGPYQQPGGGGPVTDEATVDVQPAEASITFQDQTARGTVTVTDVHLSRGGFIVIHDERLQQGEALASVIGNSSYLEPGDHSDVQIRVQGGGARTLIAMAHLDTDGDHAYGFVSSGGSADGPYTSDGQAVTDSATMRSGTTSPGTTTGDVQDEDASGLPLLLAVFAFVSIALLRRRT